MRHLLKAALFLIGIIFVVTILPRLMPTRVELQPYGFYMTVNNQDEWASKPLQYTDQAACSACHQDKSNTRSNGSHATVNCQTCHGPANAHLGQKTKPVIDTSRELCGTCHGKLTARPLEFPQIDLTTHGDKSTCITCHNPHSPKLGANGANTVPNIPHSLEGRNDCLLCHSAVGIKPFPKNHSGRTSDTCQSCHGR